MRYERAAEYSLPFTIVNNKVSEIVNRGIDNIVIYDIFKTEGGNYICHYTGNTQNWFYAESGSDVNYNYNILGTVGLLYSRPWEFSARVYDPQRDASRTRPLVKIGADKYFSTANSIFEELDKLEREIQFGLPRRV